MLRGALLLTAACFFMPMNDVCAKLLGRERGLMTTVHAHGTYPLVQVVFMRFATQCARATRTSSSHAAAQPSLRAAGSAS